MLVNPYCSLDDLKTELKLRLDETQADAALETSINDASRWVDEYTRSTWFAVDHSVTPWTLPPRSSHLCLGYIFPPFGAIRSISRIVEVGADVETSLYSVLPNHIERLAGDWTNDDPAVPLLVYGVFGYAQPSADDALVTDSAVVPVGLPSRIALSTKLVAAALSGHSRKDVVGFDGAKSSVQDREIPQEVFDLLGARRQMLL